MKEGAAGGSHPLPSPSASSRFTRAVRGSARSWTAPAPWNRRGDCRAEGVDHYSTGPVPWRFPAKLPGCFGTDGRPGPKAAEDCRSPKAGARFTQAVRASVRRVLRPRTGRTLAGLPPGGTGVRMGNASIRARIAEGEVCGSIRCKSASKNKLCTAYFLTRPYWI
jgi:hypothetical protein